MKNIETDLVLALGQQLLLAKVVQAQLLAHADERVPAEVVDAVQALTKQEGESRLSAAARAAANPIARVVKLADVGDNMDLSRIANPTDKDYARLREYEQVRDLLLAAG